MEMPPKLYINRGRLLTVTNSLKPGRVQKGEDAVLEGDISELGEAEMY